jgi:branched-chain amino acid transport system ATP-binding protein
MAELIAVESLAAGYGEASVLSGISFAMQDGQSMALLGRNGAGKTTLINTLIGLTTHRGGQIRLAGKELARVDAIGRARAGMGWVPQERNIFRSLTVEENMTAVARPGPFGIGRIYQMFPRLQERRRNLGNQLSGGEMQMLAVGRALVLNPKLLLLDEPLEGLAPIIVEELLQALRRIARDEGLSMIIVEQNARKILSFTDQALILDRGMVAHRATSAALLADRAALESQLGVVGKTPAP